MDTTTETVTESLSDIMAGATPFVRSEAAPVKAEPKAETKPEAKAEPEKKAEPEAKAETKPDDKADKPESKERDEHGRFTKTVPQEALHAERRKRQELEARLEAQTQQKPKTSVFEDEDKAISERVDAALSPYKERFFKLSIKAARNVTGRDDFDAIMDSFADAAENDPRLSAQLRESDDPGEFLYTVGKQIRELADSGGDIVKYGEKKTAAVKAALDTANARIKALEAEVEKLKTAKQDLDEVPTSLNEKSSGPAPKSGEEDPEDLKAIVRFGNQPR